MLTCINNVVAADDIDWVIVCLAIAGTVVVGAVAALVRHGAIARGVDCCQCGCCFALAGKRPARSVSSASSGAILPLHHGVSLLTTGGGGVLGSAFETSSPGTSGSVRAAPAVAGSSSGSVIGPHGSPATAGAGARSGAQPIATVSSGEDSLDNWASGGAAGMRDLGTIHSEWRRVWPCDARSPAEEGELHLFIPWRSCMIVQCNLVS